ncbi:MAG: hypothetical protein DGJ47_000670 [Rickettsiaceae bacterium]
MSKSLQELIESGEYFRDAREWYKIKYVHPFSQRSFLIILSIIICIVVCSVALNIYGLFPTHKQVRYVINIEDTTNKSTKIERAEYSHQDAQVSIIHELVTKYVSNRENYDYDDLQRQFTYVKNSSTRIVFRRFFNFMNIDNEDSPILKYKKSISRHIEINSVKYKGSNVAIVNFTAIAEDISGAKHEDKLWQANIKFDADKISNRLPSGQRFNFTITDYDLTMIKDNLK